jgi:hypothetical protein
MGQEVAVEEVTGQNEPGSYWGMEGVERKRGRTLLATESTSFWW